ncbi:NAD(P)/FAD-dependent oxidoreductase [Ancylobacter mangrovi]|uniref:NAD(P)/FAD-dependent oxidoreductase n=1 Tax=Ancylobacter mangrovi TaxID=2972472 RepID=UPI002163BE7D|nr:FAD-binding oxidoreductase [Ancylobacter mangrovi]MCS0503367.1 FAD-binding oxidoreductase [Ancylobacter mangrovi]
MAANRAIFHPDFRDTPFWWDDYAPVHIRAALPARADVVVIGAGYTGLAAGAELARAGLGVVVLERNAPGEGASTRNGGQVSAEIGHGQADRNREIAREAMVAFELTERLAEEGGNASLYKRCGRLDAAWTSGHFARMAVEADALNRLHPDQARLLPPERQREQIGSDFYAGGLCVDLAGALHPALHYKSMLDTAISSGCQIVSRAEVRSLSRRHAGWKVDLADGAAIEADAVLVATNGYTGPATPGLLRRIVPVASHMIATEELELDLAASLLPGGRIVVDSKRVLYYYRLSPDGRRMLFGGRSRFTQVGARTSGALLHAAMSARFPQLAGARITHSWTGNLGFTFDHLPHVGRYEGMHYALGCNGSGIAVMAYLGHVAARNILRPDDPPSVFEKIALPANPLYTGDPWFLPPLGGLYRLMDDAERFLDAAGKAVRANSRAG